MKVYLQISLLMLLLAVGISCNIPSDQVEEAKVVEGEETKKNVLFIVVDDFRTTMGAYGDTLAITPNLDKFASSAVVFKNAYCNFPVCGASRASFMSGMRPTKTRFTNYGSRLDKDVPEAVSLGECFKNNGYTSYSHGKIFHHTNESQKAWSEAPWRGEVGTWRDYKMPHNLELVNSNQKKIGESIEIGIGGDTLYADGKLAVHGIETLRKLKESGKPFFYAMGFVKPHLPFTAPKKYWDMYKRDEMVPNNFFFPENVPQAALHNFGELRAYTDIPKEGEIDMATAKKLKHGYYACASYVDAQIGKVLDELKRLKLDENTMVVIMGDHGWTVGEHKQWCKHTLFELAVKTPLLIYDPSLKSGKVVKDIVEFVDVYPTICDFTKVDKPKQLEGMSLQKLMLEDKALDKKIAVARFQKGVSVKDSTGRYSWYKNKEGKVIGRMYYDHTQDPDENKNIYSEKAVKSEFSKWEKTFE